MIDMQSKYDNIHKIEIFNASICINNHVIIGKNYMLSDYMGTLSCGRSPSIYKHLICEFFRKYHH